MAYIRNNGRDLAFKSLWSIKGDFYIFKFQKNCKETDGHASLHSLAAERRKILMDCPVKGNILKRHVCLAIWYALLIPPLIWTVYKGDSRINKWIKEPGLAEHQKREVNIETSNAVERDMDPSRAELSVRINHTHIHQPGKSVKTSHGCVRTDGKIWKISVYGSLFYCDGVTTWRWHQHICMLVLILSGMQLWVNEVRAYFYFFFHLFVKFKCWNILTRPFFHFLGSTYQLGRKYPS